jgi:hypothetical protein
MKRRFSILFTTILLLAAPTWVQTLRERPTTTTSMDLSLLDSPKGRRLLVTYLETAMRKKEPMTALFELEASGPEARTLKFKSALMTRETAKTMSDSFRADEDIIKALRPVCCAAGRSLCAFC